MTIEHVKAWQCIGCGKIEAPQTCIGVCQDRKVEFVYADEHEAALAQARFEMQRKMQALEAVVRQIALTTPHEGEWERSYRALQSKARHAMTIQANNPQE
ncbi:MAG TPA: hypothetical protein PLI90_07630 [Rhodocyclaceae bacterium]|nr:hypothetical protein [Rhodocyclaceae bacterium]